MKASLVSIIGLALASLTAPSAFASNAAADLGHCEYYQARSAELGCANDGYLLAFGERYCQVFVDQVNLFTEPGKATLANLRLCLQQKLEARPDLTCENVKSIAAQSHIECYTENHFCQMNVQDKFALARLIAPALMDRELSQAVTGIEAECVREHFGFTPAN